MNQLKCAKQRDDVHVMVVEPSVKGSILESVVEAVNKHRASGAISAGDLDRWLTPADRAILDSPVLISKWYPIATYDRLNTLLLETIGDGDPNYLVELGRENASRLIDSGGLYAQLEYLSRAEVVRVEDPHDRYEAFGRDLVVLCSLHSIALNFAKMKRRPDPEHPRRWICEVTDARRYPDTYALRCLGFVNEMARRYGEPELWTWERPSPDVLHWRMVRDL